MNERTKADAAPRMMGSEDPGKAYRAGRGIPVLPALDGFRAFAILGIVMLHLIGLTLIVDDPAKRTLLYGTLPNLIEVLFIISGFVVFLPTVARDGDFGSIRAFAIRRGARLLPAYFLVVGIVLAMLAFWPGGAAPPFPDIGTLLAHLTFLHVPANLVVENFSLGMVINGPLWTLSLEMTFYLLLPLIAGAYFRRPLLGLAIAAALSAGWKLGAANLGTIAETLGYNPAPARLDAYQRAADNQFPGFAFSFAAGMTAAWAFVELRRRVPAALLERRALIAQGVSLLALGVFVYLIGSYAVTSDALKPHSLARRNPILSLGFAFTLTSFMLATTLAPRRFQIPFALPFARWLGDISYGIYLIHTPMLFYVAALLLVHTGLITDGDAFWPLALTAVPLTILYGYLSARLLEQPIRRWAHRFGRRSQASDAGAGARGPARGPEPTAEPPRS